VAAKPANQPLSDDSELLRRHIEGDPRAFGELIEHFRQELFGFLMRFMGDAAAAEDVFQETFLQLHLSARSFDLHRRLKPWLFTIAANKARDAMRTRARRHAAPLDAPIAGAQADGGTYADLIPSDIPSPQEDASNLETRQAVQSIVQRMPENLRMVLLLGYFQELPYKEIADMLDVPLGTVKSRLHAAVKYFAKEWKAAVRP
jgi:RNA polymerase sigma-70 factor (ECF subfamily)